LIALAAVVPVKARRTIVVPVRNSPLALARIGFTRARIGLLSKGFRSVGFGRIRPPLAIALVAVITLAEPTLGEFLLRPPGLARAALAAGRPVAPAAARGSIVFIVIAGHETLTSDTVETAERLAWQSRSRLVFEAVFSRKTGIHFC
jgi:hypothetical protein